MINKRLLIGTSTGVAAAIVVLQLLLRHSALGGNGVIGPAIAILLTILALPMRLYVLLALGENGSWSLPVAIILLMVSGLLWGIITERVVFLLSKKATRS